MPWCGTTTNSTTTTIITTTTIPIQVQFSCEECKVGYCRCETNCVSGIFLVYKEPQCTGSPLFSIIFSSSSISWQPLEKGIYYGKINCDNGGVSTCKSIYVEEITTTIPTTTLPQISITCEKQNMIAKENNTCSISNCQEGMWFLANEKGNPLDSPILHSIPPTSITFTPSEEGIISVAGICSEPKMSSKINITVEKGVIINCTECKVKEICRCEILNCSYGLLSILNYNGKPLQEEIFRPIGISPYPVIFSPTDIGEILITVECYQPFRLVKERIIKISQTCFGSISLNISPSIVATSSLTRAYISNLSYCDNVTVYIKKDSCDGNISCTTKGNGNCQFVVPEAPGNYTYYACIDKNNDLDFNDDGEIAAYIINVIKSEEKFKINSIVCSKTRCEVDVDNEMNSPAILFIRLVGDEPEGRIYYAANLEIPPKSSGKRDATLSNIRDCRVGTKLKVIGIAYRLGDLENQLTKYSSLSFTC
jgi:hypothetical protein